MGKGAKFQTSYRVSGKREVSNFHKCELRKYEVCVRSYKLRTGEKYKYVCAVTNCCTGKKCEVCVRSYKLRTGKKYEVCVRSYKLRTGESSLTFQCLKKNCSTLARN
jgi:hypothetical protein